MYDTFPCTYVFLKNFLSPDHFSTHDEILLWTFDARAQRSFNAHPTSPPSWTNSQFQKPSQTIFYDALRVFGENVFWPLILDPDWDPHPTPYCQHPPSRPISNHVLWSIDNINIRWSLTFDRDRHTNEFQFFDHFFSTWPSFQSRELTGYT